MIVDLFLVYQFIKRLTTPFDQWEAYKLGIIDAEGNELKKRKDFTKSTEKQAYGLYDRMILRLKKLLGKLPAGQTRLATYAAALWLIKEHKDIEDTGDMITEDLMESKLNHYIHYITETHDVNHNFEMMLEDAPINSAGSGNIAGIGVGPDGEPGVSKKRQKKYQKKSKNKKNRFIAKRKQHRQPWLPRLPYCKAPKFNQLES
jgi:hypothetical protein